MRFPPPLYEQLAAEAEREHRTVSAQVIHLVARALEGPRREQEREREREREEGQDEAAGRG